MIDDTLVPYTSVHRIEADGVTVIYREAGAADAPVVLLLHGFPTSSFMYRELIPRLAGRYRVIAPDLPGFGFTTVPDMSHYKYSFEALTHTSWPSPMRCSFSATRFVSSIMEPLPAFAWRWRGRSISPPSSRRTATPFQEYFRKAKPPLLATWGKHDPFFIPAGAEAYPRDNPNASVKLLDTEHFALEAHVEEIAFAMKQFLAKTTASSGPDS